MADVPNIAPPIRDELERMVVRLLEVADRCGDHVIQHELMKLSDEVARIIDIMGE